MKHLLYILFLFVVAFGFSQEQRFEGRIYADSIGEIQVNIVNLTNHLGTTNSRNGEFSLPAKVGDSVIFSSVKYKVYRLRITEENLEKFTTIFLENDVTELEEVSISDIDLTGNLKTDANNIDTHKKLTNTDVGLPAPQPKLTQAERRLLTATGGEPQLMLGVLPTGFSLGRMLNQLSGRTNMLKRQLKYERIEANIKKAREIHEDRYFIEIIEIPEDKVDDFLYYCNTFQLFKTYIVKEEESLALTQFYLEKAKSFKKEYQIDD
ncbi:hypothetical protein [Mesonia sp. K7]|uniref:hypothetical protein n=1 Tax=Mesonia sp. K7 TaxID=2218606 RepID=UPI000DA9CAAD|nr:hypothetical protein [Mesonia sp. K7]PZD79679.1 hypothetical protein DNG35_01355 [Mesonia sp. K7]